MEKGNEEQKKKIFDVVKINIPELTTHTFGCRVIQKLLEEMKNNEEI